MGDWQGPVNNSCLTPEHSLVREIGMAELLPSFILGLQQNSPKDFSQARPNVGDYCALPFFPHQSVAPVQIPLFWLIIQDVQEK